MESSLATEVQQVLQASVKISCQYSWQRMRLPTSKQFNPRLISRPQPGKVVGNDRDVRVFHIKHIKGMEFEAVFFVNLDHTIRSHPELFTKCLYVGATRAATYLGITFSRDIPEVVSGITHHFENRWPA